MHETEEIKKAYRERLKTLIGKKIETTMIFAISQAELCFGHLWGIGLPEEKLNDDEIMMRGQWKQCRNNILNLGNAQRRNAMTELEMYDVVWKKYETVLLPPERFREMQEQELNNNKKEV